MRARAYCGHPSIRDHWALRTMSRCPDQVVSLKRDPQCLSPQTSLVLTHLSTLCSGEEAESTLPSLGIKPGPVMWKCDTLLIDHFE
ncbi:hypothetical protein TNCV_768961 [Trichonephila clavipes]|nr:hypothetical protein TNCV_768961 [Trichonephila clavipes]